MKERPILFSAPMVRAILAGRKTMTRRIVKERDCSIPLVSLRDVTTWNGSAFVCEDCDHSGGFFVAPGRCPYGKPGDLLWVRETFAADGQLVAYDADGWCGAVCHDGGGGLLCISHGRILDDRTASRGGWPDGGAASFGLSRYGGRWRPSIYMPRWASRITLEVTGVRVERLHELSEKDAWSEGIDEVDGEVDEVEICRVGKETGWGAEDARSMFGALWCEINGDDSWAANPWVWVIEFRRIKP